MIISRTPFRISFFGGDTDYPAFYEEHVGKALGENIGKSKDDWEIRIRG